jgi:IS5 family transposase
MSTFTNFAIRHEYASLGVLGDRLGEISGPIDWEAFRPLLADLYTNAEGRGGRPNCDVVLMIKLLVLQQWYGLSDPELERQATDRIRSATSSGIQRPFRIGRRSGCSGNAWPKPGKIL